MITNSEKSQIKGLITSPQWGSVQRVADILCEKISDEIGSRESEWESLRNLLNKEGQIEGIKRLFQELFNQASQNE